MKTIRLRALSFLLPLLVLLSLVGSVRQAFASGWIWNLPSDVVWLDSGRRDPVFYVGEPISFFLNGTSAARYEVRDYYGTLVDQGPTGGAYSTLKINVTQPGWYKVYIYRATSVAPWGTAVGGTTFVIFRNKPGFPTLAPPGTSRGHDLDDEPMRGLVGLGPQRHAVDDASQPDAAIAKLDQDIALDKQYYTPFDPARKRVLLISFKNGTTGPANLAGVKKIVSHFQNDVQYWEPTNEPNFFYGSAADYVNQELKPFYQTVKSINPNMKVLGPGVVTVGPYGLRWLDDFKAGGGNYIDALSFHAYNNVNGDLALVRQSMTSLQALLDKYNLGGIEKWQTEQGYMAAVYGAYQPRHQGEWTMLQMMAFEQYGIPKEHNHYWYDAAGYWDEPMFWINDDGSANPTGPLMRVWSEELYGATFASAYDFGPTGNKLYLGDLFTGPGKRVAAFMSAGGPDGQIDLKVTGGGSSLHVVSPFGVEQDLPVTGGKVTLPVTELPSYVEMAASQDIQVVPLDWGADLALAPGTTAAASGTGLHPVDPSIPNDIGKIINGYQDTWYWNQQPGDHPWMDDTKGDTAWVTVRLPSVQTIDHVVVYANPPWQWDGTLLDYELQYLDLTGQWQTLEHVQEPTKTFNVLTPVLHTSVDSFFSNRWIFQHHFRPVTTYKIRLLVHDVTYGGGATQDVVNAGGQTGPHQVSLREVEVYNTTPAPTTPTTPAAPRELQAAPGNGQAALSWVGVSSAASYTIKRSARSGGPYTAVGTSSKPSFTDTGLTNGATYYYIVTAVNAVGESANSNEAWVTPMSPVYQINGGGGAVGSFSADANFAGGSSYATTASIDTSGAVNPAPAGVYQSVHFGNFTYTFPSLTPGGAYSVRLHFAEPYFTEAGRRVFNVALNGTSVLSYFDVFSVAGGANKAVVKTFTATADAAGKVSLVFTPGPFEAPIVSGIEVTPIAAGPSVPPAAPAGLAASAGKAKVDLTWTTTPGAGSYAVKRGTRSGGPYTPIGTSTAPSFTDTGLTNGTTYSYVVTAVGAAGESGNSNEASATPSAPALTPPAAPAGLAASAGNALAALTWSAVAGADSYAVKRGTRSGGPYTPIGTSAAPSFTDTGLTNGTTYSYVVTAVGAAGESGNSNEASATPSAPPPASAASYRLNSGGGAAGAFAADANFTGGYTYSSPATVDTAGASGAAPAALYQSVRYGAFSYSFSGLTPGAAYTVRLHFAEPYWTGPGQRVFSVLANGAPALSNLDVFASAGGANKALVRTLAVSADPTGRITLGFAPGANDLPLVCGIEVNAAGAVDPPTPPAAPAGLAASAGNALAALTWSAVAGADSYAVKRGTRSGGPYTPIGTSAAPSFTDTGLTNGTTYSYVVTAVGAAGESGNSNEASATPSAPPPASAASYRLNSGGGAAGAFAADANFTGGYTYSSPATVDTAGASGAAPAALYQSVRYGAFSYSFSGLTPGAAYTVRLHFAEPYWTGPGQRVFSVLANGAPALSNLDVFASAGGANKALVRTLAVSADPTGRITLGFAPGANDLPLVCGIEVNATP